MRTLLAFLVGLLGLACSADFTDTCPTACTCKWANGKREADCTNAGFNAVPTHLDSEIQILRMSGNYVRKLGRRVFKEAGLINLQRIFMNNCHIQEIHPDAFANLKIMVELDLSNNNITNIEPGTFMGNERLQTLTLAHNQISALHAYQFPRLHHLKTIDVSHNRISVVDHAAFDNLGNSVESILINHNELRGIKESIFIRLTNLKSLQLHSNPWNCDCHLKSFRNWVVDKGLYTYPTACAEPERLSEMLWSEVDDRDFACKPEIQVPQSVVFSKPGANVTLSCFIIGSPMPEAKWVLKGRIVSNNTLPFAGSLDRTSIQARPGGGGGGGNEPGKTPEKPSDRYSGGNGQRVFITEEGGLERWFNLTIINVGIEAVSDYTCVAVNAGGVMEENVSLTFEEPEPVDLPGGKKEQEVNLAVVLGAAAAGLLFLFVLLIFFCCCCCKRKRKHQHTSSTPSSVSSRTPERHGSLIGFSDSSQRLMQHQQIPHHHHHHHHHHSMISETSLVTTPVSPQTPAAPMSSSNSPVRRQQNSHLIQQQPMINLELEMRPSQGSVTNNVLYPTSYSGNSRPKTVMVSSTSGGTEVHTGLAENMEPFPDLITRLPPSVHAVSPTSTGSNSTTASSSAKLSQPLNPAALVIPQSAPPQFPHQFPHLIHHSRTLPHPSKLQQQVAMAKQQQPLPDLPSPPQVILSPPAQFSHSQQMYDIRGSEQHADGYVTLPRQPRQLQPRSNGQHVNWGSFQRVTGSGNKSNHNPIYDGVGPRTTATGSTSSAGNSKESANIPPPPSSKSIQFNLSANARFPSIPEESAVTDSTDSSTAMRAGSNLRSNSSPHILMMATSGKRDSSGSEVTIGEESISAFCEPFGKAIPPPPPSTDAASALPPSSSRPKQAHKSNNKRSSVASSADSEMDGLLASSSSTSSTSQKGSSKHVKHASSQPQPQQQKQLKGILKGGTMSKSPAVIGADKMSSTPARKTTSKPPQTLPKPVFLPPQQPVPNSQKSTTSEILDV